MENNRRLFEEGEGKIYSIPTEKDPRIPTSYDIVSRIGIDDILRIKKGVYCVIKINDLPNGLIKGKIIKILEIYENIENKEINVIKVLGIDDKKEFMLKKKCIFLPIILKIILMTMNLL